MCSPLLFYIPDWFWLRLFESHFAIRDLIPGRNDILWQFGSVCIPCRIIIGCDSTIAYTRPPSFCTQRMSVKSYGLPYLSHMITATI